MPASFCGGEIEAGFYSIDFIDEYPLIFVWQGCDCSLDCMNVSGTLRAICVVGGCMSPDLADYEEHPGLRQEE
jgi:hypothetical protein